MDVAGILGDAQTSITSLGGGIAGAASNKLGDAIMNSLSVDTARGGIGALGIEFAVRATTSALMFNMVQNYMPGTSGNVFFSILFFGADRGLMQSGVALSTAIVYRITPTIPTGPPPSRARAAAMKPADCGCK